jgi:two-component system KDP operon response regulator KdpE
MTPPLVLIVDDEEQIRRFLRITLRAAGFTTDEVAAGREAIERSTARAPDLMLLDLALPDVDGLDVIGAVRVWSRVPIIVLSVRSDEHDKVAALDAGANDYIQKPFGTAELLARMRAAMRSQPGDPPRAVYEVGELRIDVPRHEAKLDSQVLRLSPKEFSLLLLLARNAGQVLTHRQLLVEVWGAAHAEDVQYLRVYIGQLRDKLGETGASPRLIASEPGIGYRLLEGASVAGGGAPRRA